MVSVEKICYDSNQTKNTFNKKKNWSHLSVTHNGIFDWCKNELKWWSSKVSSSTIWNDYNCTKITFIRKNNCSYLSVISDVQFNWCKK